MLPSPWCTKDPHGLVAAAQPHLRLLPGLYLGEESSREAAEVGKSLLAAFPSRCPSFKLWDEAMGVAVPGGKGSC